MTNSTKAEPILLACLIESSSILKECVLIKITLHETSNHVVWRL